MIFYGTDCKDISLLAEVVRGKHETATIHLYLKYNSVEYYNDAKVHQSNAWETDILRLEQLEPMRKWRLVFNGRLRSEKNKNSVHVRINFIWSALSAPYIYNKDEDPFHFSIDLANNKTNDWKVLIDKPEDGYEQWGILNGNININGIESDNTRLKSLRQHTWGDKDSLVRQFIILFVENDTLISIHSMCEGIRSYHGNMRKASGKIVKIYKNQLILSSDDIGREEHIINFSNNNAVRYKVDKTKFKEHLCLCGSFNTLPTKGFMQCGEKRVVCDIPALSLLHEVKAITSNLLLSLKCKDCCDSNLVGGKASSLALLNIATSTNLKYKAIVPEGFCLTVNAMKIQIDNSDLIKAILEDLDVAASASETINLQEVCQNVVTCWRRMPICEELLDEIIKLIEPNRSYAVRSSGIGEDSAVLSAAGQNTTILGCQGIDGIVYGIKECWASLYTFQSVEYRRQLGMALDCGMGVIIQEMVLADVAGVMFTRHPVSGDPDLVYVTANFGLGETVVSGSVEPDSFVVSKQDGLNLKIVSSDRGKKGKMLHMLENGALVNTSTEEINLCISNQDLINLVKVGIEIEEMFGWPKDIEWTIHKGRIYLLQCRPITSLFAWSEQELTHELDSALLDDIFTTANVGEVFPEATSPLTQSVCLRVLNKFIMKEDRRNKNLWYNNDVVCISHHHAVINTLKTFLRYVDKKTSFSQKVLELAVCGHPVSNEILLAKVETKIGFMSFWNHLSLIFGNISDTISNKSTVCSAQKLGNNFKLSFNQCTTAASLIRIITSSFVHLQQVLVYHSQASTVSVFWQMILLSILSEGNADLTSSHLEDVSQLLLSSEIVVSAEIPKLLKEISNVIMQDGNFKDFNRTPVKNTRNWLKTNCERASKMFENLLYTHGHRSIKEMDLKTETWGLDPTPLLITLKSLVKNSSSNKKVNICESEIKSKVFKSPKKEITRFFLKMLQPYSNRAAEGREVTKNAMLLIIHQLRLAYLHLGKLMMKEGKLPDPSLVFYFTHYELMVFISTEEPSILHKASRRKRLWPKWNQIKFPEIIDGFPTPLSIDISKIGEGIQVKGTLVFPGQVQGRACVLSLGDDPSVINQGDILITYCTDVGWSPLYPLLGGVVTELGGLISHGAVVAREYGLPCIVGASGVTTVFQTGDEIMLDANNGVVTKLSGTKR